MKKYLILTLNILLYVVILAAVVMGVAIFWWNHIKTGFLGKNYNICNFLEFFLVVVVYGLIFRLRKMNLIKVCNFSPLSVKNFIIITVAGICMAIFTSGVCSANFIIHKFPALRDYIFMIESGNSNLWFFFINVFFIFIGEEMIFRGVLFNEFRGVVPLYWAVFLSTAVYGVLNCYTQGPVVGVYAYIGAVFYTLAYIYLRSIWGSITVQASSMFAISLIKRYVTWKLVNSWGDLVLAVIIIVSMAAILATYYLMYVNYKKSGAPEKGASLSA